MAVELKSRLIGKPEAPRIIISHGLCGSGRNWLSIGDRLAAAGYSAELIDLRDHGQSPWTDRLAYDTMAEDLIAHVARNGQRPFVFLGHSMGGKLGMALATQHREALGGALRGLIVVDIVPKQYNPHYAPALQACLALDLTQLTSRKEADDRLRVVIPNDSFRSFLLSNLIRESDSSWRWNINLARIIADLQNVATNPLASTDSYSGPTLFVIGTLSDFITTPDLPLISTHFPSATTTRLTTGHNVHIESPEQFTKTVTEWLAKLEWK